MTEVLTRKEVAQLLKVPLRTIDFWTKTGQIPFSRLGGRTIRFSKERLDAWFLEKEALQNGPQHAQG